MPSFYWVFRYFIRWALLLYFKKIKIEGLDRIPKGVPLILACNHQNAFLDALLVGAFFPGEVCFLTRSDVFVRWAWPFFKAVNMLPVYRIRDGYHTLAQNQNTFKTSAECLANGKSVLIFSEGNHGKEYYLRPLTKGTSRLAFFAKEMLALPVCILPVGLNYYNHFLPRKKVLIVFGQPIDVGGFNKSYLENPAVGLIDLKEAITEGMKSTLVIPELTDGYEIKKTVFHESNYDLSFEELRSSSECKIDEKPETHFWARALNPLPFFVIWLVLKRVGDVVFHSSLKFSIGLVVFPAWWLLSFIVFTVMASIHLAFLAVFVMIFGLFYDYG